MNYVYTLLILSLLVPAQHTFSRGPGESKWGTSHGVRHGSQSYQRRVRAKETSRSGYAPQIRNQSGLLVPQAAVDLSLFATIMQAYWPIVGGKGEKKAGKKNKASQAPSTSATPKGSNPALRRRVSIDGVTQYAQESLAGLQVEAVPLPARPVSTSGKSSKERRRLSATLPRRTVPLNRVSPFQESTQADLPVEVAPHSLPTTVGGMDIPRVTFLQGNHERIDRLAGGLNSKVMALYDFWLHNQHRNVNGDLVPDLETSSYCEMPKDSAEILSSLGMVADGGSLMQDLYKSCSVMTGKDGSKKFMYRNVDTDKCYAWPLVDLQQKIRHRYRCGGYAVPGVYSSAGRRDRLVLVVWAQEYLGRLNELKKESSPATALFKQFLAEELKESHFCREMLPYVRRWTKKSYEVNGENLNVRRLQEVGLLSEKRTMPDNVVLLANLVFNHSETLKRLKPSIQ